MPDSHLQWQRKDQIQRLPVNILDSVPYPGFQPYRSFGQDPKLQHLAFLDDFDQVAFGCLSRLPSTGSLSRALFKIPFGQADIL